MWLILLRHSREHQSNPPIFLDRKDTQFKRLHSTCDSVFHALREEGVGANKKFAKIITKEDEDKLRELGTLNSTSGEGLQKAVFFMLGKHAACKERNKGILSHHNFPG